uniref:NADH dehydrogenase subunit 6 n=1 Tax=Tomicus yunnanensis TaxID=768153 RepID=UPI002551D547|nr:NADH dehydrogenase subunit 6 [Tomicus yunnanensis]WGL40315.1 NADH dehydrogenase subunit 6 [Tomicus yunnanensis]
MLYIFSLNWLMATLFIYMNHPLTLGFILLTQIILMSMSSGLLYYNFWFCYIIFLVMISGLLIMFVYMTSIASNEKFKMPKLNKILIFSLMILIMMIFMFSMDKFFFNSNSISILNQSFTPLYNNLTMNKYFSMPHFYLTITLMNYLLLTLIVVVKITEILKGPLRQK